MDERFIELFSKVIEVWSLFHIKLFFNGEFNLLWMREEKCCKILFFFFSFFQQIHSFIPSIIQSFHNWNITIIHLTLTFTPYWNTIYIIMSQDSNAKINYLLNIINSQRKPSIINNPSISSNTNRVRTKTKTRTRTSPDRKSVV